MLFGLLAAVALAIGLPVLLQGEVAGSERPLEVLAEPERAGGGGPEAPVEARPAAADQRAEASPAVAAAPAAPESGTLAGTVELGPGLVGRLAEFTILYEEAVNPEAGPARPRRGFFSFELERGSPRGRFEIARVPFSPYGWRVRVLAPGLNGSEQLVRLAPDHPRARVFLKLTRPVQVSIVVKDQDRLPLAEIPVTLKPVGAPPGRKVVRGTTDLLGQCLFEAVQAGPYELYLGDPASPFTKPKKVEVPVEGNAFFPLELPRGASLTFRITDPAGNPLAGVEIQAIARDSRVYRKYVVTSDRTGLARFPHLKEGRYLVHFTKKGFDRGFEAVTVGGRDPVERRVVLRWN